MERKFGRSRQILFGYGRIPVSYTHLDVYKRQPYNELYDGWWGHDTLPKMNYEDSPTLMEDIMRIARKWVSPPFNADGWAIEHIVRHADRRAAEQTTLGILGGVGVLGGLFNVLDGNPVSYTHLGELHVRCKKNCPILQKCHTGRAKCHPIRWRGGRARGRIAVSYTHLDVYKRQLSDVTVSVAVYVVKGLSGCPA